jgi:hypothetical protein
MFPSLVPSRWRLSPLFYEGAQILFFPAPISCLGERYLPAAGFPTEQLLMYGLKAVPFIAIPMI